MTPEEQKALEEKKAQEQKDFLAKVKAQTSEQLTAELKGIKEELSQLASDAKAGMSKEDFDAELKTITDKLEGIDSEKFKEFEASLKKYQEATKEHGTKLAKMEDGSGSRQTAANKFWKEVEEHVKSEKFESFVSDTKKSISFEMKTVSITDDYTGDFNFITTQDSRVVDHPQVTRLNVRSLLTVMPTDLPFLAFTEVYDWDRAVGMVSENGTLPESSFKIREATTDVKRLGTFVTLSKRMLRSVNFVLNHLRNRLPAQVRYYEDFQLLWGDGSGNNLTGIFKVADDFTTVINTSITGVAGDVASVASYDGGTKVLVTLTNAENQLHNGDTITFANATEASYNAAHTAIVISPTQFVIELTYVAEADTSAWTYTVNNPFKQSIDAAQEIDVLKVAKTIVTVMEYSCNGFVLNPVDSCKIETLKGNDDHYIDVQRLENGVLTIAGVPVVETTAMPAGKFAAGDWRLAAALGQFTNLNLEFSESTDEKLTNTVKAIIQQEVLFPIYNKYMFITGTFSTAKTAIAKP